MPAIYSAREMALCSGYSSNSPFCMAAGPSMFNEIYHFVSSLLWIDYLIVLCTIYCNGYHLRS